MASNAPAQNPSTIPDFDRAMRVPKSAVDSARRKELKRKATGKRKGSDATAGPRLRAKRG